MNERFYQAGRAANDRPGDCQDALASGEAFEHISDGRVGGGSRGPLSTEASAKAERGQAMMEIALVLPMFLLLVFAIIEIGRAWAAKQALTISAREGARILVLPYGAGLTYTSEADVQSAALNMVRASMNGSGVPVTASTQINLVRITPGNDGTFNTADDQIEPGYTGGKRGDRVGIQLTYPFETPVPILLTMFDNAHGVNHPGASPTQSVINMAMTCYMDHE